MITDVPADSQTEDPGYDIIGDVHGCFSKLVTVLHELGYSDDSGVYGHPTRQAVFVGDLIDRGPEQVAVLEAYMAAKTTA